MPVTICLPSWRNRPELVHACGRKPGQAGAKARKAVKRRTSKIEKLFYLLFVVLPFVTLIQTIMARPEGRAAAEAASAQSFLAGPRWGYTVPFEVKHKTVIESLIQCESGGRNISRPDSDGIMSDGILQYHRGPADTMAGGTWEDFSRTSGIEGSPRNPADAIRMTDWAIGHGLGPHWTCWDKQHVASAF